MGKAKNGFDNEELFQILDRIILWIGNCDTKASIFLGSMGVVIGVLLGTDYVTFMINTCKALQTYPPSALIAFVVPFVFSIVLMIVGVFFLLLSILPTTTIGEYPKKDVYLDSLLFFTTIASNSGVDELTNKILSSTDASKSKDIISQIYVCSIICSLKFKRYKRGVLFSSAGIVLFFIAAAIGHLCRSMPLR
jgi:hypothetical protein